MFFSHALRLATRSLIKKPETPIVTSATVINDNTAEVNFSLPTETWGSPLTNVSVTATPQGTVTAPPYSIEYLLVAGGGHGGYKGNDQDQYTNTGAAGGGGGAGGVLTSTSYAVSSSSTVNVTIGSSASNSIFNNLTALAGGKGGDGGSNFPGGGYSGSPGASGGSGGGGGMSGSGSGNYGGAGGAGTAGQGSAGTSGGGYNSYAGSGGGASGTGSTGITSNITGVATVYAQGGGGGGGTSNPGTATGYGTGGRGAANITGAVRGLGAPGVLILAYPDSQNPLTIDSGLTYTVDTSSRPGYRVYTITAGSGTITLPQPTLPRVKTINVAAPYSVEYLIIGGGGGGGGGASYNLEGGGGGAGGVLQGTTSIASLVSHTFTIGNGGARNNATYPSTGYWAGGNPGNPSLALGLTALPGGPGGTAGTGNANPGPAGNWGSGGGGATQNGGPGAAGTAGQGFAGGSAASQQGGGGGGAGGTATSMPAYNGYGTINGGIGITSSITGVATKYAGGGGGSGGSSNQGGNYYPSVEGGYLAGGLYGGGYGYSSLQAPYNTGASNGTPNTGAGGGGGGGGGGSGIIVIAYSALQDVLNIGPGLTYTYSTTARPGYRVYTFTAGSGTVSLPAPVTLYNLEYLIVGGGGANYTAGGGAGGMIENSIPITSAQIFNASVGTGGTFPSNWGSYYTNYYEGQGKDTFFSALPYNHVVPYKVLGGGYGAFQSSANSTGGGSGGGGASGLYSYNFASSGTDSDGFVQGYGGGNVYSTGSWIGGGGGGAGGPGNGQVGGPPRASSITGSQTYYAAGGNAASTLGSQYGNGGGGSGVIIIACPITQNPLTLSGLTYTVSTTSRPGYRVYTITQGSGTIAIPAPVAPTGTTTFYDLLANTTYALTAVATNGVGASVASAPFTFTTSSTIIPLNFLVVGPGGNGGGTQNPQNSPNKGGAGGSGGAVHGSANIGPGSISLTITVGTSSGQTSSITSTNFNRYAYSGGSGGAPNYAEAAGNGGGSGGGGPQGDGLTSIGGQGGNGGQYYGPYAGSAGTYSGGGGGGGSGGGYSAPGYGAGGEGGQRNWSATDFNNIGTTWGTGGAGATSNSGNPGIVVIKYPDNFPAATSTTGSVTVTVAGGYRIYRWTSSGSITI